LTESGLGPVGEAASRTLLQHLEWTTGPWLGFVFAASEAAAHILLARISPTLVTVAPPDPDALQRALPALLEAGESGCLVALVAVRIDAAGRWARAWTALLRTMNERRGLLQTPDRGGLILVTHHGLKVTAREASPDLWSAHALLLELPAVPRSAPPLPELTLLDANVTRIAEAVERVGLQLDTQDGPWIGRVWGPDAAPRARLREALRERYRDIQLVQHPPGDLSAIGPRAGLHWLVHPSSDTMASLAPLLGRLDGPVGVIIDTPDAGALPQGLRLVFDVPMAPEEGSLRRSLPPSDGAARTRKRASLAIAAARQSHNQGRAVSALAKAIDALLAQGWTTEAEPLVEQLVERTDPAEPAGLAAALGYRGEVARKLGDLSTARDAWERALQLRLALAEVTPSAPRWVEVAYCQSQLGAIYREQGRFDAALGMLTSARELRAELALTDPTPEREGALALSDSLLGDVYLALDDLDAAREATARALQRRRDVAEATGQPLQRRFLALAWERSGLVAERSGDLARARAAYARAQELYRDLVKQEPGNVRFLVECSTAISRLGDVYRAEQDLDAARAAHTRALEIRAAVTDDAPDNAHWQQLLAVTLGRLASLALQMGELEVAASHANRAVEITEHLVWLDPSNVDWQRGLVAARRREGDLHRATGDEDLAAASYLSAADAIVHWGRGSSPAARSRAATDLRALARNGAISDAELNARLAALR
jgi:tetratricopeptide (TPR) repeat protein